MPNTTALGTSLSASAWYLQFSPVVRLDSDWRIPSRRIGALHGDGTGQRAMLITGLTTGTWASLVNTPSPLQSRVLGVQWIAIASGVCDVFVGGLTSFWGS